MRGVSSREVVNARPRRASLSLLFDVCACPLLAQTDHCQFPRSLAPREAGKSPLLVSGAMSEPPVVIDKKRRYDR